MTTPDPVLPLLWKASRFNHCTADGDGELIVFNSLMGALARFVGDEAQTVNEALSHGVACQPSGVLAELALNGFLVPSQLDELQQAADLHEDYKAPKGRLELILMPNENCNFRCTYCYETFKRNKMIRPVIEGVVKYFESRVKDLNEVVVGWFGGEPLTAPEIIEEVATRIQKICADYGIRYSSSMVTNGYLLDRDTASMLFAAEVRQFQITVDGPEEEHNRLRVLGNRRVGTFQRIFDNLIGLHQTDEDFHVVVRVNFDRKSAGKIEGFVDTLQWTLGADPRFYVDFHPVGKWGGPHDDKLQPCDVADGRKSRVELFRSATDRGFDLRNLRQRFQPHGSSCYAADPNSFVIGSDGTVYKCTVAFEDARNQVGRMTPDGELLLDQEKMSLWVSKGEETDSTCQSCSFRPSCQGNACPWARIRTGQTPCPSDKINIDDTLRLLTAEAVKQRTGQHADGA